MAPGFPTIPLDQIQSEDIRKIYNLMYKHIAKEFVHIEDLRKILANGNLQISTVVSGSAGPYTVVGKGSEVGTLFVYQENAAGLGLIGKHETEAKVPGTREATTTAAETAAGV